MGRPLCLRPRLMAVLSFIPRGHRVVDVGTDHARLPVYLVERGVTETVIATDIRMGPLERAKRTISAHKLLEKIELRQCSGLEGVMPEEADTVVIAGMGADTIIGILESAAWARLKNLVLQPMTHSDRLRGYLLAGGYGRPRTLSVSEGTRGYTIFNVGGLMYDEGEGHRFGT